MPLNKVKPGWINWSGYRRMTIDGKQVFEHVLIIEKALGHPIPEGAETHHVDEIRTHNENTNLVLCDSIAYHNFIHMRMRAYKACGHASWRMCRHCKQYDDPQNMYVRTKQTEAYHRECNNKHQRERRIERNVIKQS